MTTNTPHPDIIVICQSQISFANAFFKGLMEESVEKIEEKSLENPNSLDQWSEETKDFLMKNSEDLGLPIKFGYLIKKGAVVRNWKRRWFILIRLSLLYYEEQNSQFSIGALNLFDAKISISNDVLELKCPHSFTVSKGQKVSLIEDRTFYVKGNTVHEWFYKVISLTSSSFYVLTDILFRSKKPSLNFVLHKKVNSSVR